MNNYEVVQIPLDEIFHDTEFNCRGYIPPIDVVDLAKDIEINGLDIPITLQNYEDPKQPEKKYRIVAGHRRHRAFTVLARGDKKFEKIPAFIKLNIDEMSARTFNLRENLHRVALNILQEARHLKFYFDRHIPDYKIAEMTGQSSNWVTVRKSLLALPADIQETAAAGLLTQDQIKAAAKIKNKDRLYEYIRKIKENQFKSQKVAVIAPLENKQDLYKAKRQQVHAVKSMLNNVYDQLGPSIVTRMLAWINGDVSTVAIHQDLYSWADENGLTYEIPADVKDAINGVKEV
jgi:ParB/RepB/Spo0J family partition protein